MIEHLVLRLAWIIEKTGIFIIDIKILFIGPYQIFLADAPFARFVGVSLRELTPVGK